MSDNVILWRCPACGKVETNTGQSARYCAATSACTTSKPRGLIDLTPMERVEYAPVVASDAQEARDA